MTIDIVGVVGEVWYTAVVSVVAFAAIVGVSYKYLGRELREDPGDFWCALRLGLVAGVAAALFFGLGLVNGYKKAWGEADKGDVGMSKRPVSAELAGVIRRLDEIQLILENRTGIQNRHDFADSSAEPGAQHERYAALHGRSLAHK